MHEHDITVFTNSHFIVYDVFFFSFKNMHFEACFQKFAFSGPKMLLSCKWMDKTYTFLVEKGVM